MIARPQLSPIVVVCPRCGLRTVQQFYGPCKTCRGELVDMPMPVPDVVHFSDTKRMDGQHAIAVRTCDDPSCSRKACVQAREEQ